MHSSPFYCCIFSIYLNDHSVMLTLLALFTFRFRKLKHSWNSEVNDINTKQREGEGACQLCFFFLLFDLNNLV